MKNLLFLSCFIVFVVSCADMNSYQNYEGVYVLNANNKDTLIIENIRVNEYKNFYYGNYERRMGIGDSVIVVKSRLAYDVTMDNLEFDNWVLMTCEENTDVNYFYYKNNKRNYVSMKWCKDVFGRRFVVCDIDNFRYYKKQY